MPEKRPSDYRAQWDALQGESATLVAETLRGLRAHDPKVEAQEAALAALDVSKDAVAHGAWLATAQDLGDLLLLAEIAWDFAWGLAGTAPFPTLPAGIEDCKQGEISVAYLIRGIVDVAAALAVSPPPARREPAGALVAEIARMVTSVAGDEAAIGVLSTGEAIAVALVLNRADLLPHGGYSWLEAVDRLGPEWLAAAHAVQRQRDT